MRHIIKDSGADTHEIESDHANELADRGWIKRCAECEDDHPGDRVYHTTHPTTDDVVELFKLAGIRRTWLVALVVPIRGMDPTEAWERASGNLGHDIESLFMTSPLVCGPRDLDDPDFDVTVLSHGRQLEHAPEPEEN